MKPTKVTDLDLRLGPDVAFGLEHLQAALATNEHPLPTGLYVNTLFNKKFAVIAPDPPAARALRDAVVESMDPQLTAGARLVLDTGDGYTFQVGADTTFNFTIREREHRIFPREYPLAARHLAELSLALQNKDVIAIQRLVTSVGRYSVRTEISLASIGSMLMRPQKRTFMALSNGIRPETYSGNYHVVRRALGTQGLAGELLVVGGA